MILINLKLNSYISHISIPVYFRTASELSIIKPFSREELHRRVVSLVRRKEHEARSVHSSGGTGSRNK